MKNTNRKIKLDRCTNAWMPYIHSVTPETISDASESSNATQTLSLDSDYPIKIRTNQI